MGVPMNGPRASGAVTSGVPDHPTFGDASTPRGPRDASRPVYRWMGVPMIGPRVSGAVTSGAPDHPTVVGSLTRPADHTKPTPLPFTRTHQTDRGKGRVSVPRRQPRFSAAGPTRPGATLLTCNASEFSTAIFVPDSTHGLTTLETPAHFRRNVRLVFLGRRITHPYIFVTNGPPHYYDFSHPHFRPW